MKKLMVLIAVTGFALLSFNVKAFAWDPSGTWGNEGRTDVKMEISCKGNSCDIKSQSNYSKFTARGFVNGDKLVVAYNHLDETECGFILFEKQDQNSMLSKTFDLKGKVVGSSRHLRQ
jgi:hypothetical protein